MQLGGAFIAVLIILRSITSLGLYNTFGMYTLNIHITDEVKELFKKRVNVAINNAH